MAVESTRLWTPPPIGVSEHRSHAGGARQQARGVGDFGESSAHRNAQRQSDKEIESLGQQRAGTWATVGRGSIEHRTPQQVGDKEIEHSAAIARSWPTECEIARGSRPLKPSRDQEPQTKESVGTKRCLGTTGTAPRGSEQDLDAFSYSCSDDLRAAALRGDRRILPYCARRLQRSHRA